jgi:hypothetical protein
MEDARDRLRGGCRFSNDSCSYFFSFAQANLINRRGRMSLQFGLGASSLFSRKHGPSPLSWLILKAAAGDSIPSPINNGRCFSGMPVENRFRRSLDQRTELCPVPDIERELALGGRKLSGGSECALSQRRRHDTSYVPLQILALFRWLQSWRRQPFTHVRSGIGLPSPSQKAFAFSAAVR